MPSESGGIYVLLYFVIQSVDYKLFQLNSQNNTIFHYQSTFHSLHPRYEDSL